MCNPLDYDPPTITEFPVRDVKKTKKAWQCAWCGKSYLPGTPCRVLPFKDFDYFPPKMIQIRTCPRGQCDLGE